MREKNFNTKSIAHRKTSMHARMNIAYNKTSMHAHMHTYTRHACIHSQCGATILHDSNRYVTALANKFHLTKRRGLLRNSTAVFFDGYRAVVKISGFYSVLRYMWLYVCVWERVRVYVFNYTHTYEYFLYTSKLSWTQSYSSHAYTHTYVHTYIHTWWAHALGSRWSYIHT
jgi:hypothetical protein